MASYRRGVPVFLVVLMVAGFFQLPAAAQSNDDSDLRKEVDQLRTQMKSVQSELDQIRTVLREQSARSNPVFDIGGDPSMGDASAKLVLIDFSDFECPFCLDYFKTVYHQLIENYVNTGKVRYVFADFPGEKIHPHAFKAAEAARCSSEQGKFWGMHDQLFTRQRELGTTGIQDAARAAGLNEPQFESCLSAGKYTAAVRDAEDAAAKLGIQGTPAFGLGTPDPANPSKIKLLRALVGAQPYAVFQQAIDNLLPK
jgi:protein-disulfide isomerase